jgi:uncharacterized membrane protein
MKSNLPKHPQRIEQTTTISILPSPEHLDAYEQKIPGISKRLIDGFLAEGEHRRSMGLKKLQADEDLAKSTLENQKIILSKEINSERLGIIMASIIAMLMLCMASFAYYKGNNVAGGTIIAAIAAIVSVFIHKKNKTK